MQTADEQDNGDGLGFLKSLPSIAWERRWLILLPFILISAAGIAAAILIKPKYRSEATIVIESAQLPDNLVPSSLNEVIDQRLARVRQRVLSRPDLIQLIRTNNLYPDMQSQPLSAIIDRMRKSTSVQPINASLGGGGGSNNTIAFVISFDYPEALPAQLVVQQYVNRFLELDADATTEAATGAAGLLQEQASGLQRQISAIEQKITAIKQANGALLAMPATMTGNPIADAGQLDSEIAGLAAESARLSANARVVVPDADVLAMESQLRTLQAKFSDTHPDVIAMQNQVAAARAAAAERRRSQPNPASAEIAANNARISSLRSAKAMILSQSSDARALQARAPAVAEQVSQLESRAEALRDQLGAINGRLQNAEVSARMQTDQKGERLAVSDPPVVPDSPVWPNRPLLVAGGLLGGLGFGLALALGLELLFRPIRGTEALRRVTGRPPLVVIPLLDRKPSLIVRLLERLSRRRLNKRPVPVR